MKVFRRNRKPAPKRVPNRTSSKALGEMFDRTLIKEARSNTDLSLKIALNAGGHADIARALEEAKKPKNVFDAKVWEMATQKLDDDPRFADRCVEAFIRSAVRNVGNPDDSVEEPEYFPLIQDMPERSSMQRLIDQLDSVNELKERLGHSSKSSWGSVLTPQVVVSLLDLAKTAIKKPGEQPAAPDRIYIVGVGGKLCEFPEQDYRRMVDSGQIRPLVPDFEPRGLRYLDVAFGK